MGNFRKRFLNRALAGVMAVGMVFTGIPYVNFTQPVTVEAASDTASTAQKYGLAENIQDGAILHCWCWSFNTIKENMADIAAAGFTTVQTSPANECNDSHPNMKLMGSDEEYGTDGCWWWQYQPTDWTIGNYQLGSKEDFQAMCDEADKYGINIIVDVIPNHVTPDLDLVSQDLYNAVGGRDNLFHEKGFYAIAGKNGTERPWEWGDRLICTTGMMGGLPDVNTENPDFQEYFMTYINDIIACGADGFRYDTAKHIGVPSDPTDPKSSKNNFWPVATGMESVNGITLSNKDKIFNYGEVLQGDNVPETEYAQYMRQTASDYGFTLNKAMREKNLSVNTLFSFQHATPSRIVTWVESHDTYCNAGKTVDLTDTQLRLQWAIITARKDGTPLFFSRPDGSNGWSNRWGNNVLGAKGNDQFKSKEVAAVNFFRNAMAGESEYLRNAEGNNQIFQVDRGTKGTVIVNAGEGKEINTKTSMADGTYTDQVSGRTFKVSGGMISGRLDKEAVAVIYNPDVKQETVDVQSTTGSNEFTTESLDVELLAKNVTNTTYTTSEGDKGSYTNGDVITVGSTLEEGETVTVTVKGNGESEELTKSVIFTKQAREPFWDLIDGSYDVYVKQPSGWGTAINCYAYVDESTNNAAWPGIAMENLGQGVYAYNIPDGWTEASVVFNDGTNQDPGAQQPGLSWTDGASMSYVDGRWESVIIPDDDPQVVSSLANASTFDTETATTTLSLKNADSGTYSIDNGPVKTFTEKTEIVIGQGKIADREVTVKTTATKGDVTTEKTFTFNKKFNEEKNGGYTDYDTGTEQTVQSAAVTTSSASEALTGKYATNPSEQMGKNKTITSAADFDESMIIAQGVANDDPRIFRGSHEGPVYDTYALYGAWDNENIYLGWQFTNVTDVVDPAQGYPTSDNGKPYNGDIPQVIALNLGTGNTGDGSLIDGGKVWGQNITYETPIDAMLCFSSKPGVGTPALFKTNEDGKFDYETAVGFTDAGISFKYEDGFFGSTMTGINGNGYSGYVPSQLLSDSSNWVNFLNEGHSESQDTFYTMTIPMSALGVTKAQMEAYGIGVMHISTFGEGGIASLPMDMTMLDNATVEYSEDASTSQEKADSDTVTVPLARLGADKSVPVKNRMTVNFGADLSAPQKAGTELNLTAEASGGNGTYTYQFLIDGKEVQNSAADTYAWKAVGGNHEIEVNVTDDNGILVNCSKTYTVEGENPKELTVSLATDPKDSAVSGSTVKLTATATGGSGTYSYKFLQQNATGGWYVMQNYGSSNTCDWTTGPVGKKTLYVDVKDSDGAEKRISIPFEVTTQKNEFAVTLKTDPEGSAASGSTVKLTATAEGGTGTYSYKFYQQNATGGWYVMQNYSSSNTCDWTTGPLGKKTLYVSVKDSAGIEKRISIPFEVTTQKNEFAVTLKTDPAGSAVSGSTVKLTATAEGGTGTYSYKFYQQNATGGWYVMQNFGASNTCDWTTGPLGKKTLYVEAKDSTGTVKRVSIPFEVTDKTTDLNVSMTASPAESAKTGTAITLTANATGGNGNLQYRFSREKDGVVSVFRDYAASNTATCQPAESGSYRLYVDVKDKAGNTASYEMTYRWSSAETPITVTSFKADKASAQPTGTAVTLTAVAEGGAGDLQYRFRCIGNGKTTVISDYSTVNTVSCNPSEAGYYILYVDVKDSEGNVETRSMLYQWN